MKITKEDLKTISYVLLSPTGLVLLSMTFILGVFAQIFSTSATTSIASLIACGMMLVCAINYVNHVYHLLILVKIERLDKKLTEWMK
jgi:hypothetical protein